MKAKGLSLDVITTLPQAIIESILCRLPIEEAVRTSILSKEWRFKWTTIPKLNFDVTTVKGSSIEWPLSDHNQISDSEHEGKNKDIRCKLFYAIYQVLLQHQGPIHEFTLSLVKNDTCFEVDQIILHLSRNHTLKRLGLDLPSRVPLSVFSLHHLTDLYLGSCNVDPKLASTGLGSLTSLTLKHMYISRESLVHLLSSCPTLKRLCVMLDNHAEIMDNTSIIELFKCLPLLEHLTTWSYISNLVEDPVPGELLPSLIHLKYFCIQELWFFPNNEFAFLGTLFKCSPNLEKLKLEIAYVEWYDETESDDEMEEKCSAILKKYSNVWLEHLTEVEIFNRGTDNELELELLRFILARSPNLKKVTFRTWMFGSSEDLKMLRNLVRPPCARPVEFAYV